MSYKLLDLFCGAGGAGMDYHRAGFEVTGNDRAFQAPRHQDRDQRGRAAGKALLFVAGRGRSDGAQRSV